MYAGIGVIKDAEGWFTSVFKNESLIPLPSDMLAS